MTQLCDPKTNTPGEPKINHWADTQEIEQVGNLQFAPVAKMQSYLADMEPTRWSLTGGFADELP